MHAPIRCAEGDYNRTSRHNSSPRLIKLTQFGMVRGQQSTLRSSSIVVQPAAVAFRMFVFRTLA
jgi:hypothetical protein